MLRYKTYLEGNFKQLRSIECEIRKFAMFNNVQIIQLNSIKKGLFSGVLFIELVGSENNIYTISDSILELVND